MAEETPNGAEPQRNTLANRSPPANTAEATRAEPPAADSPPPTSQKSGTVRDPAAPEKDPLQELLDRMERMQPLVANFDPPLARTMQSLAQQGADPDRRAQQRFRHEVAYALQDLEKSAIGRIHIAPELRSEMSRLAASAPGLEHERMGALMNATASIEDRILVRDIRNAGRQIGQQPNQTLPETQSRIDALENRVRLAQRHPDPTATPPEMPDTQQSQRAEPREQSSRPRTETPNGLAEARATPAPPGATQQHPLNVILRGMRPNDQGTGAPWDPPPTPMRGRIAAFEAKMHEAADERVLQRAEKSGRAALDALQTFSTGEGATIMNRIREAARSAPGGMAGVLSEMREGGRFADLRQQFNSALVHERGVAAAYDKAAAALARYGQDRSGVEQVIARRADAANLSAKFEQIDAQIGEAAGSTPSRKDARNMIDDLAQRAAEILHRAVDAVKSVFSRPPAVEATSEPSPSPG
jgi:hypothetical protein